MGRLLRGGCPLDPNILLGGCIQPFIGPGKQPRPSIMESGIVHNRKKMVLAA